MRIEEERRDTETDNGDPKVDQVRNPNAHSDVEQQDERSQTEINRWSSKSRAVVRYLARPASSLCNTLTIIY